MFTHVQISLVEICVFYYGFKKKNWVLGLNVEVGNVSKFGILEVLLFMFTVKCNVFGD